MSSFVLDSSAIVAAMLREPGGQAVLDLMDGTSIVGTVNLAEVVARLQDFGVSELDMGRFLREIEVDVIDFTRDQALDTGLLRNLTRSTGLSLGDRACFALAREKRLPVLTADKAWASIEIGVEVRLIR